MKPLADGSGTERDAIAVFRRQTGRDPPDMPRTDIEPPVKLMYLYRAFWEIAQGRQLAGMGGALMPLAPSETLAWCMLNNMRLRPWEMQAIQLLDRTYLEAMAAR